MVPPASGYDTTWTERKLGKAIIKRDRAALQKRWPLAIKYGEKVLEGSRQLNKESDPRYINQLKTLNRYYDKQGKLAQVAPRVERAYALSQKHLGSRHETTLMSRTLYYKLLISRKDYQAAIPLVKANIALYQSSGENKYRLLRYLKQLFSLYALSGELALQEKAIHEYLALNKELFGPDDEDNLEVIEVLVKNYCRQKKMDQFNHLVKTHDLNFECQ